MRAALLALLLVGCYASHERARDSAADTATCGSCLAITSPDACNATVGCGWMWGGGCGEPPVPAITRGICAPTAGNDCGEVTGRRTCEGTRCQAFWNDDCAHTPPPHCRACAGLVFRCVPECFPTE